MTSKEQAKNAIKWIDNLRYYKKTTGRLAKKIKNVSIKQIKHGNYETTKYCCLGAGCKISKIKFDKDSVCSDALMRITGIYSNTPTRIWHMNDQTFRNDLGFKNVAKELRTNPELYFECGVANLIKTHYSK